MLEGAELGNGEDTWQTLKPTLEGRLSLVEECLKRASDLALLA
jgi:hypothetical protein